MAGLIGHMDPFKLKNFLLKIFIIVYAFGKGPHISRNLLLDCCSEYQIFSSFMQDMISSSHFARVGGK